MKFFLDTAEINDIEKWQDIICGVTTNPTKISNNPSTIKTFINTVFDISENIKNVFFQVGKDEELENLLAIYDEINNKYDSLIDRNIIVKVPLVFPKGYRLLSNVIRAKESRKSFDNHIKLEICGTFTYDIIQLNHAKESGLDWAIVLNSKNQNEDFSSEAITYFNDIKLIGASFRTRGDVLNMLKLGYEYVTVRPDVLSDVFNHIQAEKDWHQFYQAK